jgi:hypothetical protein
LQNVFLFVINSRVWNIQYWMANCHWQLIASWSWSNDHWTYIYILCITCKFNVELYKFNLYKLNWIQWTSSILTNPGICNCACMHMHCYPLHRVSKSVVVVVT